MSLISSTMMREETSYTFSDYPDRNWDKLIKTWCLFFGILFIQVIIMAYNTARRCKGKQCDNNTEKYECNHIDSMTEQCPSKCERFS